MVTFLVYFVFLIFLLKMYGGVAAGLDPPGLPPGRCPWPLRVISYSSVHNLSIKRHSIS
jgi:hypothetical protein